MTREPQDEFRIGDVVAIAPSYKYVGDWPGSYIVVGIRHEYQREEGRLNIAIASQDEIAKKYGSTDGFRPQDLVRLMSTDGPEVSRLKKVIERDRSAVADVLIAVRLALTAREWLRLGRGSYEYDDERWKDEFGAAFDEITAALKPLREIAGDLTDSPTKWGDVVEALQMQREAETSKAEQQARFVGQIIAVEKDICKFLGREWRPAGMSLVTLIGDLQSELTTARTALEEERERCAKVADIEYNEQVGLATVHRTEGNEDAMDRRNAAARTASNIAANIRALPRHTAVQGTTRS